MRNQSDRLWRVKHKFEALETCAGHVRRTKTTSSYSTLCERGHECVCLVGSSAWVCLSGWDQAPGQSER